MLFICPAADGIKQTETPVRDKITSVRRKSGEARLLIHRKAPDEASDFAIELYSIAKIGSWMKLPTNAGMSKGLQSCCRYNLRISSNRRSGFFSYLRLSRSMSGCRREGQFYVPKSFVTAPARLSLIIALDRISVKSETGIRIFQERFSKP